MLPLSYPLRWRAASVFLMAVVMGVALAPEIWPWGDDAGPDWYLSDKLMHGLTFAGLAIWFSGQYARSSYWRFVVGLLVFGALIEACQSMVSYRTAETGDLIADVLGIGAGILIALTATGGWSLKFESWLQNHYG
jgi:VanZ family protein